jgi:AraC-like DNA-binding protein
MRASSVTVSTRWTFKGSGGDWAQLLFASRGALTVSTATGVWVVPPHQAVWIPAYVSYEAETAPASAMRTLFVRPPTRRRLPATSRAVNVSPLLRELLRRALLLQTLDRRKRDQKNLMEILLDELSVLPVAPIDLPMPRDARALRAARSVRGTPEARHTLMDASRQSGASTRTLERLFRAETGLSFGAWRQRARLLRALQLLAEDENVTQTAIAVGYESTSAFVAAFRRALGVTPGQYFKALDGS